MSESRGSAAFGVVEQSAMGFPPLSGPETGFDLEIPLEILVTTPHEMDPLLDRSLSRPRGISPESLIAQLENTIPFIFRDPETWIKKAPYLGIIFNWDGRTQYSHSEYFELCLSAHWATSGGFVPMDVDHQVRHRLWYPDLPDEDLAKMTELTLQAYSWLDAPLSQRRSNTGISSHQGEWFTVAVAAYASNRQRNPENALLLLEKIQFEITRQASVYCEVKKRADGVELLKVASLISHNLIDFDRACEAWMLENFDPLMEFAYRAVAGAGDSRRFSGAFAESGRLSKSLLAFENHRHLALLAPKVLRKSADFLLPIAPFFDDWGARIARHPELTVRHHAEIVEALFWGWDRLKGGDGKHITFAYPRAVLGLIENLPGGLESLTAELSAPVARHLKSGLFHSLLSVTRERFEEQWGAMAMNFVSTATRKATSFPHSHAPTVYLED
jgi:hypothetical protein